MNKRATLKQAFNMRRKTLSDYARFIKKTTVTARKYLKHPETMNARTMTRTDMFLELPSGMTYDLAEKKFTSEQLIEILNN